jgi:putative ABC transport system substrate-binding protein
MNRRTFVAGMATVMAAPLAATAQQASKVYRVGHVSFMSATAMEPYLNALKEGLRELGYVEGRNIVIENRSADEKPERLGSAAAELVRLNVDVIVTGINHGVDASKRATATIPIVMVYGIDPIGAGFIESMARPGGNVTGGSFEASAEFYGKKLQILREVIPSFARVALLWNPGFSGASTYVEATRLAAAQLGMRFQSVKIAASSDLEPAFAAMAKEHAQAVVVVSDPLTFPSRHQIAQIGARQRLPVVASPREFAHAGGLLSYAPNLLERWRHAAVFVDRLLKGAKAADLPVEQPTKFELVINLKTAKALGLTIPPALLLRADQVVE